MGAICAACRPDMLFGIARPQNDFTFEGTTNDVERVLSKVDDPSTTEKSAEEDMKKETFIW